MLLFRIFKIVAETRKMVEVVGGEGEEVVEEEPYDETGTRQGCHSSVCIQF